MPMSKPIHTPKARKTQNGGSTLESRVTVLETLFSATLPFLATKADIVEVKGEIQVVRTEIQVAREEAKSGMFKTALGIVSIIGAMLAIAVAVILRAMP